MGIQGRVFVTFIIDKDGAKKYSITIETNLNKSSKSEIGSFTTPNLLAGVLLAIVSAAYAVYHGPKGIKKIQNVPTYDIKKPETRLIQALQIIQESDGKISKKEMAKLAIENNLISVNAENESQATYILTDRKDLDEQLGDFFEVAGFPYPKPKTAIIEYHKKWHSNVQSVNQHDKLLKIVLDLQNVHYNT